MDEEFKLRKLYGEIVLGRTPTTIKNRKVFIKHFSAVDQGELDGEYLLFFNKAVEKGLKTEKEREENIISQGLWSLEKNKDIEDKERELQGKQETKRNLAYESQVVQVNREIEELSKKINESAMERRALIGLTAEIFARRKLNEIYIFNSLFEDAVFSKPLFSDEEFDEIDEQELEEIVAVYNFEIGSFHGNSIQKVALSEFFQKIYGLCENNIFHLFGKPIVKLSFFQSELAKLGGFFAQVLSGEPKPPISIAKDPDKIIEWFNKGKNTKKLMATHENNQIVSLVGSADDVRKAAEAQGQEIVSLREIAAKQGKTRLNKQDLMKIFG